MADCYSLTYLALDCLNDTGYGYVCTAEEREALRGWAAEFGFPLPR